MDLKRARLEKDVLEGMLFRLFERQSTWNFGQLQKETDQPAMWLKARHVYDVVMIISADVSIIPGKLAPCMWSVAFSVQSSMLAERPRYYHASS